MLQLGPRLGFQLGEVIKRLIGRAVEVSDGPFVSLPITGKRSKRWGIDQRALWQLALLEAVLSVPGHVEGLVRLQALHQLLAPLFQQSTDLCQL